MKIKINLKLIILLIGLASISNLSGDTALTITNNTDYYIWVNDIQGRRWAWIVSYNDVVNPTEFHPLAPHLRGRPTWPSFDVGHLTQNKITYHISKTEDPKDSLSRLQGTLERKEAKEIPWTFFEGDKKIELKIRTEPEGLLGLNGKDDGWPISFNVIISQISDGSAK